MAEGITTDVRDDVGALIERARARDEDAVIALIEHCQRRIVAGIEIAGVGRHDADFDDARNMALFEVWQRFPELRTDHAVCAWMHGIARRITASRVIDPAVRHRRRVDRFRAEKPTSAEPTHEGAVAERDLLGRVLRQLSPEHREVLVLRYLEGFSEADVAVQLGISVKTVSSRTTRAKRAAITLVDAFDRGEDR